MVTSTGIVPTSQTSHHRGVSADHPHVAGPMTTTSWARRIKSIPPDASLKPQSGGNPFERFDLPCTEALPPRRPEPSCSPQTSPPSISEREEVYITVDALAVACLRTHVSDILALHEESSPGTQSQTLVEVVKCNTKDFHNFLIPAEVFTNPAVRKHLACEARDTPNTVAARLVHVVRTECPRAFVLASCTGPHMCEGRGDMYVPLDICTPIPCSVLLDPENHKGGAWPGKAWPEFVARKLQEAGNPVVLSSFVKHAGTGFERMRVVCVDTAALLEWANRNAFYAELEVSPGADAACIATMSVRYGHHPTTCIRQVADARRAINQRTPGLVRSWIPLSQAPPIWRAVCSRPITPSDFVTFTDLEAGIKIDFATEVTAEAKATLLKELDVYLAAFQPTTLTPVQMNAGTDRVTAALRKREPQAAPLSADILAELNADCVWANDRIRGIVRKLAGHWARTSTTKAILDFTVEALAATQAAAIASDREGVQQLLQRYADGVMQPGTASAHADGEATVPLGGWTTACLRDARTTLCAVPPSGDLGDSRMLAALPRVIDPALRAAAQAEEHAPYVTAITSAADARAAAAEAQVVQLLAERDAATRAAAAAAAAAVAAAEARVLSAEAAGAAAIAAAADITAAAAIATDTDRARAAAAEAQVVQLLAERDAATRAAAAAAAAVAAAEARVLSAEAADAAAIAAAADITAAATTAIDEHHIADAAAHAITEGTEHGAACTDACTTAPETQSRVAEAMEDTIPAPPAAPTTAAACDTAPGVPTHQQPLRTTSPTFVPISKQLALPSNRGDLQLAPLFPADDGHHVAQSALPSNRRPTDSRRVAPRRSSSQRATGGRNADTFIDGAARRDEDASQLRSLARSAAKEATQPTPAPPPAKQSPPALVATTQDAEMVAVSR